MYGLTLCNQLAKVRIWDAFDVRILQLRKTKRVDVAQVRNDQEQD